MTLASNDHNGDVDLSEVTQERKDAFKNATAQYFELLSSIDVGLRRQINALEDAKIIPAEATSRDTPASQSGSLASNMVSNPGGTARQTSSQKGTVTGGGLGILDVGWLNSRNDKVGKEKEAALWEDALRLVRPSEEQPPPLNANGVDSSSDQNDETSSAPAPLSFDASQTAMDET